jgi:hypothetical protein
MAGRVLDMVGCPGQDLIRRQKIAGRIGPDAPITAAAADGSLTPTINERGAAGRDRCRASNRV